MLADTAWLALAIVCVMAPASSECACCECKDVCMLLADVCQDMTVSVSGKRGKVCESRLWFVGGVGWHAATDQGRWHASQQPLWGLAI